MQSLKRQWRDRLGRLVLIRLPPRLRAASEFRFKNYLCISGCNALELARKFWKGVGVVCLGFLGDMASYFISVVLYRLV